MRHFPGEAEARREIVVVGIDESGGKFAGIRADRTGDYDCYGAVRGRDIQVRDAAVFLGERRVVFVAHAEVQRQAGPYFPVVLRVTAPEVLPEVGAGIAVADGAGLRQSQHEIRQVETRSVDWQPARVESAGRKPGEIESTAPVLIGARIEIAAAELQAPGESVGAVRPDDAFARALALVAREDRRGVAQSAEVGEVQAGGAVIQRIAGRAGDAQLRGDIRTVGEEWRGLAGIAIERHFRR